MPGELVKKASANCPQAPVDKGLATETHKTASSDAVLPVIP